MPTRIFKPIHQLFVGIDIAAVSFTATRTIGGPMRERVRTFDQSSEGYTALQRWLSTIGVAPGASLLGLEATGSYWVRLAALMLHEAGSSVRGRAQTNTSTRHSI